MRVLVVDDNHDAAMSLGMLMDVLGYENRVAYAGEQALQMANGLLPQVVLLDLGIPEMDG